MVNFTGLNADSSGIPSSYRGGSANGYNAPSGLYLAKVVENVDEDYQGQIFVELVGHQTVSTKDSSQERRRFHKIRPTGRFGGAIQGGNFTQAYGESYPPPSAGTEVLVAFTGREQEGFLLGVLGDANRNSMVPGLPASRIEDEPDVIGPTLDTSVNGLQEGNTRTRHPVANALAEQGIGLDPIRGIGSSGGRRESPSRVAGQLTPGGHSFVMDDGTFESSEKNINPDSNRESGQNNLVRLRSAGGAQMLFNDSAGIVYIINQSGGSWIQMDSGGNVDVYAQGSVSYHAEEDFNLYAGGDFNIDADTVNVNSRGGDGIKMQTTTGGIDLKSNRDIKLTTDLNLQLKASGFGRITTGGILDLNGPEAATAEAPTSNSLTTNLTVKESINGRVPEHEPWGGHLENVNAVAAQAPSRPDNSTTDYDVSDIVSGTGRTT